jgi:hypothetical protein
VPELPCLHALGEHPQIPCKAFFFVVGVVDVEI